MSVAARIRREGQYFFTALSFLTRIPAPAFTGWEEGRLARSARYFPLAGMVAGALAALVWFCAAPFLPPLAAALLTLAFSALLTGALHEDGLADCADGLGGGFTRERALEIMKDSRVGTYGALALIFSVGIRAAALAALAPLSGALALIAAAVAARAAVVLILLLGRYARKEGGKVSAEGLGKGEAAFAFLTALAGVLIAGPAGLAALFAALILARLWLWRLNARLGGYTGDGLGAAAQFGEMAALLIFAGIWT